MYRRTGGKCVLNGTYFLLMIGRCPPNAADSNSTPLAHTRGHTARNPSSWHEVSLKLAKPTQPREHTHFAAFANLSHMSPHFLPHHFCLFEGFGICGPGAEHRFSLPVVILGAHFFSSAVRQIVRRHARRIEGLAEGLAEGMLGLCGEHRGFD